MKRCVISYCSLTEDAAWMKSSCHDNNEVTWKTWNTNILDELLR